MVISKKSWATSSDIQCCHNFEPSLMNGFKLRITYIRQYFKGQITNLCQNVVSSEELPTIRKSFKFQPRQWCILFFALLNLYVHIHFPSKHSWTQKPSPSLLQKATLGSLIQGFWLTNFEINMLAKMMTPCL